MKILARFSQPGITVDNSKNCFLPFHNSNKNDRLYYLISKFKFTNNAGQLMVIKTVKNSELYNLPL